jgi:hypothetical protein
MLVLEKAIAAQTTYTASIYQADGVTSVALNISATESGVGRYIVVLPANTPASPPNAPYLVIWRNGTAEVARCQYAWDGAQEITASTLSPKITTLFGLVNAGGTAYTTVALANAPAGGGTPLFDQPTKDYLLAIPQAPLLAASYTAPNNAGIIDANATLTAIAPKISTLFGLIEAVGDRFKATALINSPGSSGGLTQPQVEQLNRIDSNSAIARKAVTNKAMVDVIASTATIMNDDGITPVFKIRMLNAAGQPNVEQVVSREVVPL